MLPASHLVMDLLLVSHLVMDLSPAAAPKMEPGLVSDLGTGLGLASAAAVTLPAVQSSAVLELSAAQSLMAWTHLFVK